MNVYSVKNSKKNFISYKIQKLKELNELGILSFEEFKQKKIELLMRINLLEDMIIKSYSIFCIEDTGQRIESPQQMVLMVFLDRFVLQGRFGISQIFYNKTKFLKIYHKWSTSIYAQSMSYGSPERIARYPAVIGYFSIIYLDENLCERNILLEINCERTPFESRKSNLRNEIIAIMHRYQLFSLFIPTSHEDTTLPDGIFVRIKQLNNLYISERLSYSEYQAQKKNLLEIL